MPRQRFTPEQIISKLREVEVLVGRAASDRDRLADHMRARQPRSATAERLESSASTVLAGNALLNAS